MVEEKQLTPKLSVMTTDECVTYVFRCPGCSELDEENDRFSAHGLHVYYTWFKDGRSGWQFNGDIGKPSFTPSLLNTQPPTDYRCHLFVTDGKIHYCADCSHKLAGQVVDMIETNRADVADK